MKKKIQYVSCASLIRLPDVPAEPIGNALWHFVNWADPVRKQPNCPQSKRGVSILVRNIPGEMRVLPWGTEVEVVQ